MGGAKRDDPKEARAHFEIASCEECDSQARLREVFGLVTPVTLARRLRQWHIKRCAMGLGIVQVEGS